MSRSPPGFTREDAQTITRKINSELSPEEQAVLNQAGQKLQFWTNAAVFWGFMGASLPFTLKRLNVKYRFFKGLMAGAGGALLCLPFGMLYGARRAQQTILQHPNHEHLLKVLSQTRKEMMAGRGGEKSTELPNETQDQQSWPAEQSQTFPNTPAENPTYDEDALLSDEEIARRNKGPTFSETPSDATNTQQTAGQDKSGSAWDRIRAQAEKSQDSSTEEKNGWSDDKWK